MMIVLLFCSHESSERGGKEQAVKGTFVVAPERIG